METNPLIPEAVDCSTNAESGTRVTDTTGWDAMTVGNIVWGPPRSLVGVPLASDTITSSAVAVTTGVMEDGFDKDGGSG